MRAMKAGDIVKPRDETAENIAERIANFYPLKPNRSPGCVASWRGACPVHGGKSRTSFVLSVSVSGRILINCFLGCSIDEIAAQIETDIGISLPRGTVRDDDAIRSVAEAVNGLTFSGRTAATDQAVLRALLEISRRIGSLEIGASLRELAEIG